MRRIVVSFVLVLLVGLPLLSILGAAEFSDPSAGFVDVAPPLFTRTSPVDAQAPHLLRFNGFAYDPALGGPTLPAPLRGTSELYIVQFDGPISDSDKQAIAAVGGVIVWYQPTDAFLVRMPDSQVQQLRTSTGVRAVVPYDAGLRLSPELLGTSGPQQILVVPSLLATRTASAITHHGGSVHLFDPNYVLGTIDAGALTSLAHSPEVASLAPWHPFIPLNDLVGRQLGVRQSVDGPYANDGSSLWSYDPGSGFDDRWTGEGMIIAVGDTGVWGGHNFLPVAKHAWYAPYGAANGNWADCHGHGTHVSGTTAGGDSLYAGMAPEAHLIGQVMLSCGWGVGAQQQLRDAYVNGANASTNSWGEDAEYGVYGGFPRGYDIATRDANDFAAGRQELLVLFAAGNSGPGADSIGPPATAKNIITIGAASANSLGIAGFSSRGPTDDGRIKPDLMATGEQVTSASLACAACVTSWAGTSMATPASTGSAVVLMDYHIDQYGVAPSPALTKALLINGAVPLAGQTYPGMNQGWGRINVPRSVFETPTRKIWFQEQAPTLALLTGQEATWDVDMGAGSEMKVNLVWGDQPGAGNNPIPALVNDLGLELVAPDASVYTGNNFVNGFSVTGGSLDGINNVEGFRLAAPQAGVWQIKVKGSNVPIGPQDFALVISGDIRAVGDVDFPWVDLQLDDVEASALEVTEGDTVTFSGTVSNLGNIATTGVSVSFFHEDEATPLATALIGDLSAAPDFLSSHTFTFDWQATRGLQQEFRIAADPDQAIAEPVESNNDVTFSIDVHYFQSALALGSSPYAEALPGQTVTYSVEVTNNGDLDDTYELAASPGLDGWTSEVVTANLAIPAGQTEASLVTVSAPEDALAGDTFDVDIDYQASGDGATQSVTLTTTVLQVGGFDLSLVSETTHAEPAGVAVTTLLVTNEGNGLDSVSLNVDGAPLGWLVALGETSVTLGAHDSREVILTVTPPLDSRAGESATITVTASSAFDPQLPLREVSTTVDVDRITRLSTMIEQVDYEVLPGNTAEFNIEVHNLGNSVETVSVDAMLPQGWTVPSPPSALTLNPGWRDTVVFQALVANDQAAEEAFVTFEITNGQGYDVTEVATVNVLQVHHASLLLSTERLQIKGQGDGGNVTVTLSNDGNGEDTFLLKATGFPRLSKGLLARDQVTLSAGQSTDIDLSISTTDATAKTYVIKVAATSALDERVSPSASFDLVITKGKATKAPTTHQTVDPRKAGFDTDQKADQELFPAAVSSKARGARLGTNLLLLLLVAIAVSYGSVRMVQSRRQMRRLDELVQEDAIEQKGRSR